MRSWHLRLLRKHVYLIILNLGISCFRFSLPENSLSVIYFYWKGLYEKHRLSCSNLPGAQVICRQPKCSRSITLLNEVLISKAKGFLNKIFIQFKVWKSVSEKEVFIKTDLGILMWIITNEGWLSNCNLSHQLGVWSSMTYWHRATDSYPCQLFFKPDKYLESFINHKFL